MSGIILPGKGSAAQSSGGIELPKGFARRQTEEEQAGPTQEAAAPEPAAPEAAVEGAPARGGRPGADLLFPPVAAQVQCPNCGTPYVVPVFSIIDLGANPELGPALLGGQVNMAICPSCGAGGPLSAPLMVHSPAHDFLGVYVPPMRMDEVQRQKLIGDLTQALMRKLPTEARKGYMLQPREYPDWDRFVERLWEFQGVTPEMLRRQRAQTEALMSLARLADDDQALGIAVERNRSLIDRQFFAVLDRLLMLASSQGDQKSAQDLLTLREKLLEQTEAGQGIKALQDRVAAIVTGLPPQPSRADVVDALLQAWTGEDGREVVSAVAMSLAPLLDYEFLLAVANRLDATTDPETRQKLEDLRSLVMSIQERQRQAQQNMAMQAQEVLQAVLEAQDTDAALQEYADLIDEGFLGLLAGNIERAEKSGAAAAARRLRQVYDKALAMLQDQMPPELQLINQLLNAPDKGAQRKVLQENRSLISPDFVLALRQLEEDFRSRGQADIADRLKDVRAQAALMM
jgi:hypothetical protein